MSWFEDENNLKRLTLLQSFCVQVVKAGNMPKHVAFIMDGNRRYARINAQSGFGHSKGFEKLTEVLHWSFELGIPEVTVYALSIENFKRSKEEVETLTSLFKEKLDKLYEERDKVNEYGLKVRFLGDTSMFSKELQHSMSRIVKMSRNNAEYALNIAVAYTSRHEIATAVSSIKDGISDGVIETSDIDVDLIDKCLYTNECRAVDLLIRTSGEIRLSDFLLWQSSYAMLSFVDQLWPEFSFWTYLKCIIKYQLEQSSLKSMKELYNLKQHRQLAEVKLKHALENLSETGKKDLETDVVTYEVEKCLQERTKRVELFLSNLKMQREQFLLDQSSM